MYDGKDLPCRRPGIYNVVEDNVLVSTAKDQRELDWDPAFRRTG